MTKRGVYSFGPDSPIKFYISDRMAKLYNEAAEEFFKAQQRFNQKFGRKWTSNDATKLMPRWSSKQRKAWNDFAKIFADTIKEYDQGQGFFHANDIMDDFLVKNPGVIASVLSKRMSRAITVSVTIGVLYGLLKGRIER